MDLQYLAVFHAVATEGGVTAAARRLGKSPPAVHHALKQFERRMGRPLFERVGRSLRLTADGRAFHREIERSLGGIERATREWSNASTVTRPLRLGAVSGFGRFRLFPRLLKRIAIDRAIEITFDTQDDLITALRREQIDLAVIYKPLVAAQIDIEPIAEEELTLIRPAASPAIRNAEAAMDRTFITYQEYEYVFGRWFKDVLGRQPASLKRLDHTSELDEAMSAVAAGRGVTIAPRDAWAAGPWRAETRCERIGERKCTNTLYLAGLGANLASDDARMIAREAR